MLLVLGSPNEDIVRISARYPILAFFLAITCINKRPQISKVRCRSPDTIIDLGPYGTIDQSAPSLKDPYTTRKKRHIFPLSARYGIPMAHLLACFGAGAIVWSTVDLAFRTVVTWACWTSFYPIIWLTLAVFHHILAVVSIRYSLKLPARALTAADDSTQTSCTELVPIGNTEYLRSPIPSASLSARVDSQAHDCGSSYNIQVHPDDGQVRGLQQVHLGARSALLVCDLRPDSGTIDCTHRRWAELSKASMDLLNNATYLYGTAIFSSLTMISGHNAIKVLSVYASVAVVSRVIADWVLEEIGGTG